MRDSYPPAVDEPQRAAVQGPVDWRDKNKCPPPDEVIFKLTDAVFCAERRIK